LCVVCVKKSGILIVVSLFVRARPYMVWCFFLLLCVSLCHICTPFLAWRLGFRFPHDVSSTLCLVDDSSAPPFRFPLHPCKTAFLLFTLDWEPDPRSTLDFLSSRAWLTPLPSYAVLSFFSFVIKHPQFPLLSGTLPRAFFMTFLSDFSETHRPHLVFLSVVPQL